MQAGSNASNEANEDAAHANYDNCKYRKKVDCTMEVNKNMLKIFIRLRWYQVGGKDPLICICKKEPQTNENQTTEQLNQQN